MAQWFSTSFKLVLILRRILIQASHQWRFYRALFCMVHSINTLWFFLLFFKGKVTKDVILNNPEAILIGGSHPQWKSLRWPLSQWSIKAHCPHCLFHTGLDSLSIPQPRSSDTHLSKRKWDWLVCSAYIWELCGSN